jgi:RND family efflux transporter MFP subunit
MPRTFRALALVPALAITCLACGGGASPKGGKEATAEPPRKVKLAKSEAGRLPRVVPATGTLAADERSELAFKVAGRIAEIPVDLGSRVRTGQVVARLAPEDFSLRVAQAQSTLAQARARLGLPAEGPDVLVDPATTSPVKQAKALLEQARVTRDRGRTLFEEQLIPRSDLDRMEADYGVAEGAYQASIEEAQNRQGVLAQRRAELDLAKAQFADSVLRAPFSGAIEERRAAPGDYVSAGTVALVLVRTDPLRLRLSVPEREAEGLLVGLPVRLSVGEAPENATGESPASAKAADEEDAEAGSTIPPGIEGRIARLGPSITEASRTLDIEVEIPNRDGALRPGAFARAEIVVRAADPAVLVPASSVVSFAGVDKVIGVDKGKAVEKRVRLGRKSGDQVEIVSGLAAGESVVLAPGNLTEGQAVEVEVPAE